MLYVLVNIYVVSVSIYELAFKFGARVEGSSLDCNMACNLPLSLLPSRIKSISITAIRDLRKKTMLIYSNHIFTFFLLENQDTKLETMVDILTNKNSGLETRKEREIGQGFLRRVSMLIRLPGAT